MKGRENLIKENFGDEGSFELIGVRENRTNHSNERNKIEVRCESSHSVTK